MISIVKILWYLCLLRWIDANGIYFHEPSYIEIRPPSVINRTDFGYTMGYSRKENKLVVGAPHHDLFGKVFDCGLKEIMKKKNGECSEIDINIDKLASDYKRDKTPNQSFCLGGSIAVGENYILTCAPLWTSEKVNFDLKYGAYGTCFFITDSNVTRYRGLFEQDNNIIRDHKNKLYGGVGWSTLIDDRNNLSLISLAPFSQTKTDVGFIERSPSEPVQLLRGWLRNSHLFKKLGGAFVSGLFFGDTISYALSSQSQEMIGVVVFLQKNSRNGKVSEVKSRRSHRDIFLLKAPTENIGSMFGVSLCAANLNNDKFDDLLVGAPAQGKDHQYESGAIHIFLGGTQEKLLERRTIVFDQSGAHFGQAIAANDVDKDGFPEIFVSAPFKDSGAGAVYVLNGLEIKNFVEKTLRFTETPLSKFERTQTIQNEKYKTFGYSLHSLPDLDGNGRTEIAVGAPDSGKVLLYRSIATIYVEVSSKKDRDYVLVKDKRFHIILQVTIKYPEHVRQISENLFINMNLLGNGIFLPNGYEATLNITDMQPTYLKNITVEFSNEDLGFFQFSATVTTKSDDYLLSKDFDETRLLISPYSKTNTGLDINRQCNENCKPKLFANIRWTGRDRYILGSTINETLTVIIHNEGYDTFTSCARIVLKGCEVGETIAKEEMPNEFTYSLPQPMKRNETVMIDFKLYMNTRTNLDEKLEVNVHMYDICEKNVFTSFNRTIPFVLSTNQIYVDGISNERNVTDTQVLGNKIISDNHVYNVINNGSVMWKSVKAIVKVTKRNFIVAYRNLNTEGVTCRVREDEEIFSYLCDFDLQRQQSLRFLITLDIAIDKLVESLRKGHLYTSSNFELVLNAGPKINGITTKFNYVEDIGWGQDVALIISVSVLMSVGVIFLLTFILYKRGFFVSKKKIQMEELKHEIFKQSIKRANVPGCGLTITNLQQENIECETGDGHRTTEVRESSGEQETNELHESNEREESKIENSKNECDCENC